MIRRFLTWLRRPKHVWQPTGTKFNKGCGGPYDYDKAIAGKQRALERERQVRRVASGEPSKPHVVSMKRRA